MEDKNDIDIDSLRITPAGIIEFLAGSKVEGIGKVYARRLVDKFGTDAIRILRDDPMKALEISGLGENRIKQASDSIKALSFSPDLYAFLYSCGVSDLYVDKIIGKYRKKARDIIMSDPYSMVEDVWRLSFFTADKIGKALGIDNNDDRRIRGSIMTAIKNYAESGHLFATRDETIKEVVRISGCNEENVSPQIEVLKNNQKIIESKGGLYLPVYYNAEKRSAEKLKSLLNNTSESFSESDIPKFTGEGQPYSEKQREAILKVLNSGVMVLTGGPGTGKTTVMRGVVETLRKCGKKVTLAAPTGRAAKRLSTLTGEEASTIHRLLGFREGQGYNKMKIDTDALIIDEGSMLEQVLFDHLLESLKPGTKVIVVGDVDQLPAIGAGDVMRDMIESGKIPVARLNENFRQKSGSKIAEGARMINFGEIPKDKTDEEFLIIAENNVKDIHNRIINLVSKELPEKYEIEPTEIQVVSPQQIGPLGAKQLNTDLQEALNPDAPFIKRGATIFRLGDPIMQTLNSKAREVYNGEIGRIIEVDPEGKSLTVEFSDGRKSIYQKNELSELTLAYATTVHKLQGSEVKYMVFPITMAHKPMLYRNLLYTGVSRASKICVLVGEEEALEYAVGNNPESSRNSNFSLRLEN